MPLHISWNIAWHLCCRAVLTQTSDAYNSFTDLTTQTSLDVIGNDSNCTVISERVIFDIRFYALGVIIPAGLLGNIISIVVFLSCHLRRKSPGQYFIALALADNIVLLGELCLWLNKSFWEKRNINIHFMSDDVFLCKFVNYVRYLGRIWSSLIVMTISIERLFVIFVPMKAKHYSTPNCARLIITLLLIFGALVSSPIFSYVGIGMYNGKEICRVYVDHMEDFLVWCLSGVVAFEMIVPGIVIFIVTGLMIYRLTVATSIRTMLQASRVFKERRSEKQTNMTLIAVALSFLLLRPPYIISYCVYFRGVLWKNRPCDPLFDFRSFAASGITYIFAVLNYSLNFVLYFVSGSSFRKEFYFTIKRRSLKVTSPSPTAIRRLSRRRSLSDSAIHSSIQVPQHIRRFHSATTAINFSKWTDSATCSSANYHLAYSLARFVQVDILSVCVGYIMVNENTYMCICITICVVWNPMYSLPT